MFQNRRAQIHFAALALLGFAHLTSPAFADPLNPLDFPSLGKVRLASGAYSIDTTGTTPTLVGPNTNLRGTVSTSGIAVFRFDNLTVNAGADFTATATTRDKATRPLALLASGNLTFAGTLNASGANGGNAARGAGGGGRFGGGDGTAARDDKPGGAPGSVNDVEPNMRLSGGAGGGGGLNQSSGGGGGAGGGAVEFGALGALNLTGSSINAKGGNGGDGEAGSGTGGGGGGGGAVLLHAANVTVSGNINARGGKGGQGRVVGSDGGGGSIAIQSLAVPDPAGTVIEGGFTDRTGRQRRGIVFEQPKLTPTNLNFGSVPIGSSITLDMTTQNTGTAGSFVNAQFPQASAPFARVGTGIVSGLKSSARTTSGYTFAPAALGPFSQNLTFLSNAGPVSVMISGTGIAPTKTPARR